MFLFKAYSSHRDTNSFSFRCEKLNATREKECPDFPPKGGQALGIPATVTEAKVGRGTRLPSRFYGNRRRGRPSAGPRRQAAAESTAQGRPGPQGQAGPATVWGPGHPDFTVKEPRLWKARAPGAAAAQRGRRDCPGAAWGRGKWRLPGGGALPSRPTGVLGGFLRAVVAVAEGVAVAAGVVTTRTAALPAPLIWVLGNNFPPRARRPRK